MQSFSLAAPLESARATERANQKEAERKDANPATPEQCSVVVIRLSRAR
jgi:hypothetical protein